MQRVLKDFKGLQRASRDFKGLQKTSRDFMGLSRDFKGLQSEVDTLFWTPFLRENKTPAKKRCLDEQTTIETVYPRVQGSSS
uniref:hypothetical protein n=1 Tax=Magnetococcus massalia (strain MO-1) TaxID=451514 RepID=UPI00159EDFAB|nr:hypothetical protein [Candidatus Magnetococcus massalia]